MIPGIPPSTPSMSDWRAEGEAKSTCKLLPCPFCGGDASADGSVQYSTRHDARWADGRKVAVAYFVNCVACGVANKGMIGHRTRDDAIAAWNQRA